MKNQLFLSLPLIALGFLGTGCSDPLLDEPLAAPPPQVENADMSSIIEPGKAPVAPPPGMAAAPVPTAENNPIPEAVATEQTLHTLNMFLLEYQAGGGRIPATVDEMVSMKIVPKLPPPPSGKRFEVDQQKAVITFADI